MSEQDKKSPPKVSLQSLLNAIQKAPSIKSIKIMLQKHIQDVFEVEIAAVFLAIPLKHKLASWLLVPGDSSEQIVLPIETNSIVGFAAAKKKSVTIRDPYDFQELRRVGSELSFSNSYDEKAKIRSKQILAVPILHYDTLMGVVELINKRDDTEFTYQDENKLTELAGVLAAAFFKQKTSGKKIPPKYEFLLEHKVLSWEQLEQGLAKANKMGEDLETVLINSYQVPRLKMGHLLAEFYSTSFVDLEEVDNNPITLFRGINIEYFEQKELVPLSLNDGKLTVAVKNIENPKLAGDIQEQVPGVKQVDLVFAFQEDIRSFWERARAKHSSDTKEVKKEKPLFDTSLFDFLEEGRPQKRIRDKQVEAGARGEQLPPVNTSMSAPREDNKPREQVKEERGTEVVKIVRQEVHVEDSNNINEPEVVQLVNEIIEGGCSSQASDIHIEPYGPEEKGEVRYRIDGVCRDALKIPQQYVRQVVDRIKFLASLKRAERARPQDGTIKFITAEGKEIELRVATIPTADNNEDIVLRILPGPQLLPVLDELMPSRLLAPFQEILERDQGLILVVGPAESGKTTTLHSALDYLNSPEKKIWTAEYPVEIRQHRIRQVQVDPLVNYTFAAALHAFRRADPDVVMIGDMQDPQTAVMAVDAVLDGHLLLLSSLAADSAAEGILHCLSLELDPTRFAAALSGVLAQRQVRTLCEHCKKPYHPDKADYDRLLESYGISFFDHINVMYSDDLVFYRAKGCPRCSESGYHGKTWLYELLMVTPVIRELIMKKAPIGEIIDEAMGNDMSLLLQEGIQLFFKGAIDSKELMSVCL